MRERGGEKYPMTAYLYWGKVSWVGKGKIMSRRGKYSIWGVIFGHKNN